MPSYILNQPKDVIERAVSGAHFYFDDAWGFTGDTILIGSAYFDAAQILDASIQNNASITGDLNVYGDVFSYFNNNLARINVTGGAFVESFTGTTNFNKLIATGDYSEISHIRGGLKISGDLAVAGGISNTGNQSLLGNFYLLGDQFQTGENHLLGDYYQTGTSRISGALYVNGIQITGGAVGGGSSVDLTGDIFSVFSQKGQLLIGSGNGTGSLLSTGTSQSGYSLFINPTSPLGLEWRLPTTSVGNGLTFFKENYGRYATSPSVENATILSTDSGTNTSIVITPKGEGGFKIGTTGQLSPIGNRAVDLQMFSDSGDATAMGDFSVIGGGRDNLVHAFCGFAVGYQNKIQGASAYSFAGGESNYITESRDSVILGGGNEIRLGDYSVLMGNSNTATASYSKIFGPSNTCGSIHGSIVGSTNAISSGLGRNSIFGNSCSITAETYNTALGRDSKATRYGEIAFAAGTFSSDGQSQGSILQSRGTTTNGTQTEIFLDGASKRITLASNSTHAFEIYVSARLTSGSANESAGYILTGLIKNDAGTVSLVGSLNKTVLGENDASWDVTAEADNTNDALVIKVTGASSKTIRWSAGTRLQEVHA